MSKRIKSPRGKLRLNLKQKDMSYILSRHREIENNYAKSFGSIFRGREDAWGKVEGKCVRERLTDSHYIRHLKGEVSLGSYPLLDDGTINFACVDLDFRSNANSIKRAEKEALRIHIRLSQLGIKSMFERSKSGLIHIWLIFSEPVEARKIREIINSVLSKLNLKTGNGEVEIFPKQDKLNKGHVGNYINLPCFGAFKELSENRVILDTPRFTPISLQRFLDDVENNKNTPETIYSVYHNLTNYKYESWDKKKKKIIQILSNNHHEGIRQELTMNFAGFAAKEGISWIDTQNIIEEVAIICEDDETKMRLGAIKSTYNKASKGESVKGYSGLKDILSIEDLNKLKSLLTLNEEKTKNLEPVPLWDFMGTELPEINWIVETMMVEGSVILLVGKPKLGKSIFALNLGLSVAQGKEFLEKETVKGRVLYIALEDRPRLIQIRLWQILQSQKHIGMEFICRPLSLDDVGQREELKALIISEQISLIIIDPLIETYRNADENNANDMAKLIRPIREIVQSTNCSCLVVHHSRKGSGKGMDDIRGSSALYAAADGAIMLRAISGQGKKVSVETNIRDAESGKDIQAQLNGSLRWELEGEYIHVKKESTKEKIVKLLEGDKVGIEYIADSLAINYDTVKKSLQKLVEEGIAKRIFLGKNRKAGHLYTLVKEIPQEKTPREIPNNKRELDKNKKLKGKFNELFKMRNKLLDEKTH